MSRVSITYTTITDVLIRFFNDNNYTTPVVFQDQSVNFFQQMGELMQSTLQERSRVFLYGSRFVPFQSTTDGDEQIKTLLSKASVSSRG